MTAAARSGDAHGKRLRVLESPAFMALMLTVVHSAMTWSKPGWISALPELVQVVVILPFVPAMILFNTEMPPDWTNYSLVPAAAFCLFWLMLAPLAWMACSFVRAVKGPH